MANSDLFDWLDGLQKPPEYIYPTRIIIRDNVVTCDLSSEEVPVCGKLNNQKDELPSLCAVNKDGSQGVPEEAEKMAICGMCMRR